MSEFDPEFTQPYFKIILSGEAGIAEVAGELGPVGEAAVVEGFEGICDDKGDDVVREAFFEHDETADTAVAILEGVNAFEGVVEVQNIIKRFLFEAVVAGDELLQLLVHEVGWRGIHAADFVFYAFIGPDGKPTEGRI